MWCVCSMQVIQSVEEENEVVGVGFDGDDDKILCELDGEWVRVEEKVCDDGFMFSNQEGKKLR